MLIVKFEHFDFNVASKVTTVLQKHPSANAARADAILKDSLSIRHYIMKPRSLLSQIRDDGRQEENSCHASLMT